MDHFMPYLMPTRIALQLVTFSIALLSILMLGYWANHHRSQWGYAVPPLSWLGHVIVFYSVVFTRDIFGFEIGPSDLITFWSVVVRLHAAFLICGISLVLLFEQITIRRNGANGA